MKPIAAALLLTCLTSLAAHAQTVYRCGPQGNHYSDEPCRGGRVVAVNDERSEAQRRSAEAAARREQALADRMTRERRAEEARAKPLLAAGIYSDPVVRPRNAEPVKVAAQDRKVKRRSKKARDERETLRQRG